MLPPLDDGGTQPPRPRAARRAGRPGPGQEGRAGRRGLLHPRDGLAGLGFLVAYGIIGVGSIVAVQHSNLALGGTLSIACCCLASGATIWVRHLMPDVELTEMRHPMHSTEQEKAAFKETFEEGADASQFVKRPIVRRSLIAATMPLAVAPIFLLRDLGPLPGTSLDTTVWRKGLRLLVYGTGRPDHPGRVQLTRLDHQCRTRGLPG